MKVKSDVKAGGISAQHNQTVSKGLRVQSKVKAGEGPGPGTEGTNHNQTVKGLRVKSMIRAGLIPGERNQHNQTVARRAR